MSGCCMGWSASYCATHECPSNPTPSPLSYRRKETIGNCELYLGDCLEILPTLGKVDAVVTDPPYGLDGLLQGGKSQWSLHRGGRETQRWDSVTIPTVNELPSRYPYSIIWGGHLYDLPPARGWLVWNKIIRNWSSGECEFAWTNLDQPIRAFDYSHGQLANEGKLHPTQKPEPLMRWCIEHLPEDRGIILDPFMGSGTTGVACVKLGRKFIGIEIDDGYFDIAVERIRKAYAQPDMFIEPRAPEPKQEALL